MKYLLISIMLMVSTHINANECTSKGKQGAVIVGSVMAVTGVVAAGIVVATAPVAGTAGVPAITYFTAAGAPLGAWVKLSVIPVVAGTGVGTGLLGAYAGYATETERCLKSLIK
jgi:hypothetical protein